MHSMIQLTGQAVLDLEDQMKKFVAIQPALKLLVLFVILALATPVSAQYEGLSALFFFIVIGLPIIGLVVLIGIVIAVSVSIGACIYFCIKKSNQQSSTVVPGGPVMLVPVTAPDPTTQEDSEKKEADDSQQETESGTPQQGPGVVYPPQGVVFAPQQGPGGVVYPVPVGYPPQQGVVVMPQDTTDTPQEQRDAEQEET